ncbi:unnamed protein product [Adineta ricciae]|nr:unnamed protein product [Adineta ricciae]
MQIEPITAQIPTSSLKDQISTVSPVSTVETVLLPSESDIIVKFTLNKQQSFAFKIVCDHLDGDYSSRNDTLNGQLLMCVLGCGGTGKTQLIRAITNYFQLTNRCKMLRKLMIQQFIHSWVKVAMQNWRMNGVRLNRVVKPAKHVNPEAPFGGVNMIFFGDYLQYSPVLDKALYQSCSSMQQHNDRQIDIQRAQKVMSQINCVVKLEQQMRTEGAPILVFRNTVRTQINNRAVLNKAIGLGVTHIVCVPQDYVKGTMIDGPRLCKAILELPDNRTEHLPGYLPLVPGMPVLLTENIATELGLSNGTRGVFHQLVYEECLQDTQLYENNFPEHTKFVLQRKHALVDFPSCKLDYALSKLEQKIIPICLSEPTFQFDVKELLTKTLPLLPAYSITTHKGQGQTLGKVIIDLVVPPGPVEIASTYVPLSRVKRLKDLLILRPFKLDTVAKETLKHYNVIK